jgi:hypothetical protein
LRDYPGERVDFFSGALTGLLTHARVALRDVDQSVADLVTGARDFSIAHRDVGLKAWGSGCRQSKSNPASEPDSWKAQARAEMELVLAMWEDAGIPTLYEGDDARRAGVTPIVEVPRARGRGGPGGGGLRREDESAVG